MQFIDKTRYAFSSALSISAAYPTAEKFAHLPKSGDRQVSSTNVLQV
ncbi:MAG: hypothetical protein KME11_22105 [Timaviella obliquedivisa GSE-PSE-MK23-08B]|nr:hypothetical protein [Timaviella obliquedivisa GSE-PSE-MK23-08B]